MSVPCRLPRKTYSRQSILGWSWLAPCLAFLGVAGASNVEDLPEARGEAAFEESKDKSGASPMQWAAGFHPVLWDDNYKLGLGLSTGLRIKVMPEIEAGGEVLYTRFRPHIRGFKAMNEMGARIFALRALHLPAPFTLKLGGFAGWHHFSNEDDSHAHLALGGEAQAAFDFVSPWGLYLQFSPGYAFGDNGQGLFRLGVGATYNLGGQLGKQPKAKLKPPTPDETSGSGADGNTSPDAIDFGGTMVPLPEPDHDSGAGGGTDGGSRGEDPVLKDLQK